MPEVGENLLAAPEEHILLDRPEEEKLRGEVEALRREVEQLRNEKRNEKKDHGDRTERPRNRTLILVAVALAVVLVLAFFLGWLPHHRREEQLQKEAKQESQALPRVNFIRVASSGSTAELMLPGNTEAYTDAPILARAGGYVEKRYVDIGDHVRKGQLMAIITAPDLDQQVVQAQAQLSQARAALKQANASVQQGKANMELARVTADRYQSLVKRGAISRQDNDTQQTNFQAQVMNVGALQEGENAAAQNVESSRANLQRLVELQSYERVTAPFDGVVTLRNIDVGALITTGSTLLFRVAQVNRLRTYISVPQPNAPGVKVGQTAQLTSPEFGLRQFTGVVTRTAGALDQATRTLLTEVQVENLSGDLRPGMYMNVKLQNPRTNPPVLVPGDALVVDDKGSQVAVLSDTKQAPPEDENKSEEKTKSGDSSQKTQQKPAKQEILDGTVRLRKVSVGRDYGASTEILVGLAPGDMVVVNPNDSVRDGVKVRATATKANLDVQNGTPAQQKQSVNTEKIQPLPGAESVPKKPSQTDKKRGPGF